MFYAQSTSTVILGREEGQEKVRHEEQEGEAEEEEDRLASSSSSRQVMVSRQWVQTISRLISIKLSEAWEP